MPASRRKRSKHALRFRFETAVCVDLSTRQSTLMREFLFEVLQTVRDYFPFVFVILIISEEMGRSLLSYHDYMSASMILIACNTPIWCFYQIMHPLSFVWNEIAFCYLPRKFVAVCARYREDVWILISIIHVIAMSMYLPCFLLYRAAEPLDIFLEFPFDFAGVQTAFDESLSDFSSAANPRILSVLTLADLGTISLTLSSVSIVKAASFIVSKEASDCEGNKDGDTNLHENDQDNIYKKGFPKLTQQDLDFPSDCSSYSTANTWIGYTSILAVCMHCNQSSGYHLIHIFVIKHSRQNPDPRDFNIHIITYTYI
uniref:Uncharacterized protein n=1 Tax=Norrisiella sphaerica TaxID=552664 RepID=A0A7S2QT40_9EUKA|mmetsp:Transcript_349/g.500  ORF Transcript_349/g.500 Transcript_349/m.500 type:complete len:314 (+) Transcript_349:36-977(+)